MATNSIHSAPHGSGPCLLYMYLWPFWMFKDASKGSFLERAAAYRHNREKLVYLPGYVAKWGVIFVLFLSAVAVFEAAARAHTAWEFSWIILAGGAGILASSAFVVVVLICVVYAFLGHWEHY